jgi:hypothetical protein
MTLERYDLRLVDAVEEYQTGVVEDYGRLVGPSSPWLPAIEATPYRRVLAEAALVRHSLCRLSLGLHPVSWTADQVGTVDLVLPVEDKMHFLVASHESLIVATLPGAEKDALLLPESNLDTHLPVDRSALIDGLHFALSSPLGFVLEVGLAIVVVLQYRGGDINNMSSETISSLAGTIYIDWYSDLGKCAELLVHESAHGWLSLCFQARSCALNPTKYYSPWREKLRPERSILQGAFAFACVIEYYVWLASVVGWESSPWSLQRLRFEQGRIVSAMDDIREILTHTDPVVSQMIRDQLDVALA